MELTERKYRDALKALRGLVDAGFAARLAGGCVRDRLLGQAPVDFDVATTARPEDVVRIFTGRGYKTIPTGLAHGTVTLLLPSGPVEITTLRVDVATDGRHAVVAFGDSFEADAARRDFTINAMFEDENGVIFDFFGGQADLGAGILRFVGDPAQRLREDYLRIMRFFRFWARLGFTPAPGTEAAVASEAAGLRRVSQERITSELLQTLAAPALLAPLKALIATGVWPLVLPEVAEPPSAALTVAQLALWQAAAAPRRGLAVLGGLVLCAAISDAASARRLGERLRLATADCRRLAFFPEAKAWLTRGGVGETAEALAVVDAAEAAGGPGAFEAFFAPVLGAVPELAPPLALVTAAEATSGHLRRAKLPLTGGQVAHHLKLAPGPDLGKILLELKRAFRNGQWRTAEEGRAWLDQRLA